MKAILLLEDGSSYLGRSFGHTGEVFGEVVFNTSMTGYQEILTDPSYHGQIVTMTYLRMSFSNSLIDVFCFLSSWLLLEECICQGLNLHRNYS